MEKNLIQIYEDEIKFLLKLKESITVLNNRIHDKLALIAIEKFSIKYPKLEFRYDNAGTRGIDITGLDKNKNKLLVAEVKTTILSASGLLGPQKKSIEKDLQRLSSDDSKYKYLVVLSDKTVDAIERQLKVEKNYQAVNIINALKSK